MYASTSRSDHGSVRQTRHQRVAAAAAVSFKHDGTRTRLDRLYQQGSAKMRFPKTYDGAAEIVLINTAGGLTGGDQLNWDLRLGTHASVVASTQACEKAYRSNEGSAQVTTGILLEANSTLHWLPQETILYDQSALTRSFDVVLSSSSRFLAVEPLVLGREAMGEALAVTAFHDRWRIRMDDKLHFADDLRVPGSSESIATLNNMRAVASFLYVGPEDDEQLQQMTRELRAACSAPHAGFSSFGGKITGRILAADSYQLRQALIPILKFMRGTDLPRVWRT